MMEQTLLALLVSSTETLVDQVEIIGGHFHISSKYASLRSLQSIN